LTKKGTCDENVIAFRFFSFMIERSFFPQDLKGTIMPGEPFPRVETSSDPISPPSTPPCIDASGSITVCCGTSSGDIFACTLFTGDPRTGGASVCRPITTYSSNGSLCAMFPAGGPAGWRWVQWSDCCNGSVYPTAAPYSFVATDCPDGGFFEKRCCGEPTPVALKMQLEAPLEGGASTPHAAVNQPVSLIHSQDPGYARCWFSPPIGAAGPGANPAYWMLKKTGDDSWTLCLRRVSHELARYHLKAKDSNRLPITLKKGEVSEDYKNWPETITIHAAK
jgi:hypothetical protein